MFKFTVYTSTYGVLPYGDGEPELLEGVADDIEFDRLTDVARYLGEQGLTQPSETGAVSLSTWFTLPDGERYAFGGIRSGATETVTAHVASGFTTREWAAVVAKLTA